MKFTKTLSVSLLMSALVPFAGADAHQAANPGQAGAGGQNSRKKSAVAPDLFDVFGVTQTTNKVLPPKAVKGRNRSVKVHADLLWSDALTLNLFDDLVITAVRDRLVDKVKGRSTWIGHVEGEPDSEVFLTVIGNVLSGTVRIGENLYEVNVGANGLHEITQVDPSKNPKHSESKTIEDFVAEGGQIDPTVSPDSVSTSAATTGSGTVIDLLVAYTPKALTNASGQAGIESKIVNAVAKANQAYINSNIDMQLNLVHMVQTNYTESGDMGVTLNDITGANDGKMDEIHALRTQYGADQVALVSADANFCGIAYVMSNAGSSFAPYAFSVIHDDSRSACLSNNTLAHELGHNQGDAHNRENAGVAGSFDYSYAYRLCQSGGFRTVMAYSCSGGTQISYFSNPNVIYNGEFTGTATEDNARSMTNTKSIVAAFRASVDTTLPNAPGNASALALSDSEIGLSWSDNAGNETGFRLERSADGVNWSEIAVVSSNVTGFTDNGLAASTTYQYRVRAYNSIGNSSYSNSASATTSAPIVETCISNTPALTLAPTSVYTLAGASVSYNITLANQDSSVCGLTTFTLTASDGTALGAFALSPGSSAATAWAATAPSADGSYTQSVTASAAAHTAVTKSATVVVDGTAPTAPGNLSAAVKRKSQVAVSWSASSDSGSGFDHYVVSRNGSKIASITGTGYTDKPGTGTFTYTVEAFDKAGNAQGASVSISVGSTSTARGKK